MPVPDIPTKNVGDKPSLTKNVGDRFPRQKMSGTSVGERGTVSETGFPYNPRGIFGSPQLEDEVETWNTMKQKRR